jgi:non-ribosomal peptide synthetase component F
LSILQAAWAILLQRLTGSEDICFGNVVSGRTLPVDRIDEILAPLFNVLPIRLKSKQDSLLDSILDALQRTNDKHLEAPHYPLRRILKVAGGDGSSQLFDTILILQKPVETEETIFYKGLDDQGDSNVCTPDPGSTNNSMRLCLNSFRKYRQTV